jgi:NADPH:quinone reductase-like Zn-dependent oxidoreductase
MVRSLGADHVFDYRKEDVTESGQLYDVVLDNVGNLALLDVRRVLKPQGKYILIGGGGPDEGPWIGVFVGAIKAWVVSLFVDQEMGMFISDASTADLEILSGLMQSGKVTPIIDRTYPMTEAADAMRYLEEGHARAKVVVTFD